MVKKLLITVCCFAICLSLTACTTGFDSLKYIEISESDEFTDTLVAENSEYTLRIDKSNMGLVLTRRDTSLQWSTTPRETGEPQFDEFGMPIKKHPRVESVLWVECKNFEKNEVNTYYSYTDAVNDGQITYSKLKNGIVINYHFSEAKIMIPLECVLTEKGVTLSVNPQKIQENENKVLSISIAPFFCGVKNDTENSYLFVPSGCGALVGVDSRSEQGEKYSAQIYGYDPAINEIAMVSNKESVRLNAFGAKMNDKGMLAVVDGSPASASVNVTSGSTTFGYSACYASFQMRGYTNHIAELFTYERVENAVYSKKMINKPVSVTFCPLSGEDADYSGMAKHYREYLINNYGLKQSCDEVPLNIRILGGTEIRKSVLGIPYKTVCPTTTLDSAKKIMTEIKNKSDIGFTVELKGFGESGVDVGKIAGNYTVNKNLGSLSELKELFEYTAKNNIGLYFDFDIERFNTNSVGVSAFFDAITNAGEQKAVQYYYDLAVRDKKEDTAYNLLSPSKFKEVFNKISKKTDKYNISGVALDTLSTIAYSDYTDKENADYYSKNGFVNSAVSVIDGVKSDNKRFMASGANLYSAVKSDIISESPVTSDKSHIFMYDIPFYQMVFKGSVPITVQSINLTAKPEFTLLNAIETGSGLGYTVIANWESSLIDAETPYFYNSVFSDNKSEIFKNIKKLSDYYNKISGKHIIKHSVFENGLRETVFENGISVYVNYTDKTISTAAGDIASYDYLIP